MKKDIISILKGTLPGIVLITIQVVASTIIGTMGVAVYLYNGHFDSMQDFVSKITRYSLKMASNPLVYLIYAVAALLIMIPWLKKANQDNHFVIGRKFSIFKGAMIPVLILMAFMLQIFVNYIANFLIIVMPNAGVFYAELMEKAGLSTDSISPLMFFYAVILGPIVEELTFRGVTFSIVRKDSSFWVANVVQAVMFGFIHMNLIQGIYAFLLGLVLGYVIEKTHNILSTIFIHIVFNGISGLASYIVEGVTPHPTLFCITLFISMCGCYLAIMLLKRITDNSLFIEK